MFMKIKFVYLLIPFVALPFFAASQAGLAMHYDDSANRNSSIDYIPVSPLGDGFVLAGSTSPASMTFGATTKSNMGALGRLPRIQLRIVNSWLQTFFYRTYAEFGEITSLCPNFDLCFETKDAKRTSDGGYIICGRVYKTIETSACGPAGAFDEGFLLKTDLTGVPQWYRHYRATVNGSASRFMHLNSVVEDPTTGNFITCGDIQVPVVATQAAFYMVTAPNGNPITSKYYPQSESYYQEVAPHDQGGNRYYVLVGNIIKHGPVVEDIMMKVINANGALVQHVGITNGNFPYGVTGLGVNDSYNGKHIAITGSASHVDAGQFYNNATLILKLDPISLSIAFAKRYEPWFDYFANSVGSSILTYPKDGRIAVVGHFAFNNAALYLETDAMGNLFSPLYPAYGPWEAQWGRGIALNTSWGYPVFSGDYDQQRTFAQRNNYGYYPMDCREGGLLFYEHNVDLNFYNVNDQNLTVGTNLLQIQMTDLQRSEKVWCGQLRPTEVESIQTGQDMLTISPNPANDLININFETSRNYKKAIIEVTDLLGRTILKKDITGRKTDILRLPDNLPSGQYMLSLRCDGTLIKNEKLTVIK